MNIHAILSDKWVRIGGGIFAAFATITFLPAVFGWMPDAGLVFFNIVLAIAFFNLVVQRHPIISLRWLYGINTGLGILILLAALPGFSESAMAGITVLILVPLNIWHFYRLTVELRSVVFLRGKFLPVNEGDLSLEFTEGGTLVLGNGTTYRYSTRKNTISLIDGDSPAMQWEIVKCEPTCLMVKDAQGRLHEYKKHPSDVKPVGGSLPSLGAFLNKVQDNARLQAKWTPQDESIPSIQFTQDGAFISGDGKAGKYDVEWPTKTITIRFTDTSVVTYQIVSLSPSQLVLSQGNTASIYLTQRRNAPASVTTSPAATVGEWEIPDSDQRPSFTITNTVTCFAFEEWTYDVSKDNLTTVFTALSNTKDYRFEVLFFDAKGVQVADDVFHTSTTLQKGRKYEGAIVLPKGKQVARVVIRKR